MCAISDLATESVEIRRTFGRVPLRGVKPEARIP